MHLVRRGAHTNECGDARVARLILTAAGRVSPDWPRDARTTPVIAIVERLRW